MKASYLRNPILWAYLRSCCGVMVSPFCNPHYHPERMPSGAGQVGITVVDRDSLSQLGYLRTTKVTSTPTGNRATPTLPSCHTTNPIIAPGLFKHDTKYYERGSYDAGLCHLNTVFTFLLKNPHHYSFIIYCHYPVGFRKCRTTYPASFSFQRSPPPKMFLAMPSLVPLKQCYWILWSTEKSDQLLFYTICILKCCHI